MTKITILTCTMLAPFMAQCQETNAPAWRDPFWPVGYAPAIVNEEPVVMIPSIVTPVIVKKVVEPPKPIIDWDAARKMLKITGFAEANGVRSCFVDGRLVSEGETVSRVRDGLRYTWRVVLIDREPRNRRLEDLTVRPVEEQR